MSVLLPFERAKAVMEKEIKQGKYLNPETKENTTQLATINRLGLITTDSQEGRRKQSIIKELGAEYIQYVEDPDVDADEHALRMADLKERKARMGHHYTFTERAYLIGFMKRDRAAAFVTWMNGNTDKLAYICLVTKDNDEVDDYKIGVTYEHTGPSKKNIKDINYSDWFTSLPLHLSSTEFDTIKRVNARIKDDSSTLVQVTLADLVHGRLARSASGLYQDVVRGLKAVPVEKRHRKTIRARRTT